MLKIGQDWGKIANYLPQCSTKICTHGYNNNKVQKYQEPIRNGTAKSQQFRIIIITTFFYWQNFISGTSLYLFFQFFSKNEVL